MTYSLTIPDEKIPFFMELIKGFPFIKAEPSKSKKTSKTLIDNDLDVLELVTDLEDYTLEQVDAAQNFKGIDEKKFKRLMKKIRLEDEPIDELLATIR